MTPARFTQCLLVLRWTPINLASALHCNLAWIEAMETGEEEVPEELATWLEKLTRTHEELGIPVTYRGKGLEPATSRAARR